MEKIKTIVIGGKYTHKNGTRVVTSITPNEIFYDYYSGLTSPSGKFRRWNATPISETPFNFMATPYIKIVLPFTRYYDACNC